MQNASAAVAVAVIVVAVAVLSSSLALPSATLPFAPGSAPDSAPARRPRNFGAIASDVSSLVSSSVYGKRARLSSDWRVLPLSLSLPLYRPRFVDKYVGV